MMFIAGDGFALVEGTLCGHCCVSVAYLVSLGSCPPWIANPCPKKPCLGFFHGHEIRFPDVPCRWWYSTRALVLLMKCWWSSPSEWSLGGASHRWLVKPKKMTKDFVKLQNLSYFEKCPIWFPSWKCELCRQHFQFISLLLRSARESFLLPGGEKSSQTTEKIKWTENWLKNQFSLRKSDKVHGI